MGKDYYPAKVWNIAIHISISCFIYCFSISAMNSCLDNIGATLGWDNSYLLVSLFTTLFPVGCLIGSACGSSISQKLGLRNTLVICNIVNILFSLICIIPTNYTFGAGRLVTGFIGGIFLVVPAVFINELTPDEMAGQLGTLIQQACNFAFVCSYSFGLAVPNYDLENDPWNYLWMAIIFFPALVSLYQLYFFHAVFRHESPGWLIHKGRGEEAREVLRMIYKEKGVEEGMKRLQAGTVQGDDKESALQSLCSVEKPNMKEIFCSQKYRKMLRIALALCIGQQSSGSMVILLYSTKIFESMGGGRFMAKILTLVIGVVILISGLATLKIIGKYGRRGILITGQILLTLILLSLGFVSEYLNTGVALSATLVFLFFIVFSVSLGATFWAYIGEVCNDQCISIGLSFNFMTVVLMSFLFPVLQNFFGISICFFIFGLLALMLLIYELIEVFETKGLSKQQIMAKVLR